MIGYAQNSGKDTIVSSSIDFSMPTFSKENSIINEFSPLSEKAKLSMYIYNYSKNAENELKRYFFSDSLNMKDGLKIYTAIEQSQKNVTITNLKIGEYQFTQTMKAVSDEEIRIFAFNREANIEKKMVPIALLIDYKYDNDEKAKKALNKILECRQLEDLNEFDIEYLKSKSNLLNVVTYIIE
jgi:hypothetical protein